MQARVHVADAVRAAHPPLVRAKWLMKARVPRIHSYTYVPVIPQQFLFGYGRQFLACRLCRVYQWLQLVVENVGKHEWCHNRGI
jgi:hypothetical protein